MGQTHLNFSVCVCVCVCACVCVCDVAMTFAALCVNSFNSYFTHTFIWPAPPGVGVSVCVCKKEGEKNTERLSGGVAGDVYGTEWDDMIRQGVSVSH